MRKQLIQCACITIRLHPCPVNSSLPQHFMVMGFKLCQLKWKGRDKNGFSRRWRAVAEEEEAAEMERSTDPGFSLQLVPLMAYDSVSDLRRPTAKWFIHQRLSRVLQWYGWFTCMRERRKLHLIFPISCLHS